MSEKSDDWSGRQDTGTDGTEDFQVDLLTKTVIEFLAEHGTVNREQLTKVLTDLHDDADTPRLEKARIRGVLRGLKIRFLPH